MNGTVAAHRPYGYSNFFVPIDHLLRRNGERTSCGSRCAPATTPGGTPGAGIYRNVWLLSAGPVHLAPDGLQIRTPEIDAGGAVVTVAAEVRNRLAGVVAADARVSSCVDADGAVVARARRR